jgi:hypothetical protein
MTRFKGFLLVGLVILLGLFGYLAYVKYGSLGWQAETVTIADTSNSFNFWG